MLRKYNDSLDNLIHYLQNATPAEVEALPKVTRWNPHHHLFDAVASWQERWQDERERQAVKDEAVQAIHGILQEMGQNLSFAHARTHLVEILAQTTGYQYGLLMELEGNKQYMRVTAVVAPPLLRQRVEKIIGFSLLGHRFRVSRDRLEKLPRQEVFTHLSDYYGKLPRAVGYAVGRLMGLNHLVYIPQRVGTETVGALTLMATEASTDLDLLQHLCDYHFIYALRLMANSATLSTATNLVSGTDNALLREERQQERLQKQLNTAQQQLDLAQTRQVTQQELFQEQTLAWQLAHQRSQQEQERLERLRRAQNHLYQHLHRSNFRAVVIDAVRYLIECDDVMLLAPEVTVGDQKGRYFKVVAATERRWVNSSWRVQSYWEEVLQGRARLAFDVNEIPEWHGQKLRPTKVTSALHVAILSRGEPLLLVCTHEKRGYFNREQRELVAQFAQDAQEAVALADEWQRQAKIKEADSELLAGTPASVAALTLLPTWLAHSLDAAVVMNGEGQVLGWNPAAEKLFGWAAAEVRGKLLHELIVPAHLRGAHERGLAHYLATGEGPIMHKPHRFPAVHRSGRTIPILLSLTALGEGEKACFLGFMRDLSEAETVREELETIKAAVVQTQSQQKQLLGNINHELRTPLNAIIGLSSLLLSQSGGDLGQEQEVLQHIRQSGYKLLDKMNDIFALRQFEAGEIKVEAHPFVLGEALQPVVERAAAAAEAKGIEFIYCLDPAAPLSIKGDARRWQQIVAYLVDNGIKFTNHGQVVLSVTTKKGADGTLYGHIVIKDTGVGLPQGAHQQLFQPFYVGEESLTRVHGGLGLGLTLTQFLVKALGGKLWLDGGGNNGAVAQVMLPLEPLVMAGDNPLFLRGQHVLIVTDNPAHEEGLRRYLHGWGGTTEILPLGEIAASIGSWPALPDLIIVEQTNNLSDPLSHGQMVRELLPGATPVLLLTPAHLGAGGVATLTGMGIACCPKPYFPAVLRKVLGEVLGMAEGDGEDEVAAWELPGQRILVATGERVTQNLLMSMLTHLGYEADTVSHPVEILSVLGQRAYDVLILDGYLPDVAAELMAQIVRGQGVLMGQPYIICLGEGRGGETAVNSYISMPMTLTSLMGVLQSLPAHYHEHYEAPAALNVDLLRQKMGGKAVALLELSLPAFVEDAASLVATLQAAQADDVRPAIGEVAGLLGQNSRAVGAFTLAGLCEALRAVSETALPAVVGMLCEAIVYQYGRLVEGE
ncbi:MAG TPA: PAS domain S-box protein [Anaerolineae bacterium]|nr:PAS domain S-box protein [Anaerolineae bacterium]